MCRCLKASTSGFYAWTDRSPSPRERDNQRLLERIREHHEASDGVLCVPQMHAEVSEEGETASPNRIARIMARAGLQGIPQRRQWRRKPGGVRPADVRDHLERDFTATEPTTKWVADITFIHTAEGWLHLCVVIDLFGGKVIGCSMSTIQDRHLVLKAVLMACWQRPGHQPVILHSDRGTQFTSSACERFLKGHHITLSIASGGTAGTTPRPRASSACSSARGSSGADTAPSMTPAPTCSTTSKASTTPYPASA
jgi:putative transposase